MATNLYNGSAGTSTVDNLIYDVTVPTKLEGIIVISGAGALKRGSVLGKVTASGKCKLADKAAETGEEVAMYILADDVDATSADVKTAAYASGNFNSAALTFKAANAIADHKDNLRMFGIFTDAAL